MNNPKEVRIVEVGPRDGLQNIAQHVPTKTKIEFIQRLRETGLRTIELTSIVSPKAVPQLKDGQDVLRNPIINQLLRDGSMRLPVLVPNVKGLEIASQHGVSEVAVFISATEGFSKANINCTVAEGLKRAQSITQQASKKGMLVRGYVSCIFADPFDGKTPPSAVLHVVQALLDLGCYEVSLGDTLGVGSPHDVRQLLSYLVANGVPLAVLAGHFHDTYGQALANVWEAYNFGLRVFDASTAGLGGCPFAPGATGNIATEDLVYMFERAGVSTNIDLEKVVETGLWISNELQQTTASRAGAAIAAKRTGNALKKSVEAPVRGDRLEWTLVEETDGLLMHRSSANLKITMNRPKNGNTLTSAMIHDLTLAFSRASEDSNINRVLLTGAGRFFCTGMDLGKGTTLVGVDNNATNSQFDRLCRLFETIAQCPKVTISCLNGPAFGGGVGLAFSCDLRLLTKNAKVTLSEAKLGLCPATISKQVIREWGVPFSREAMLLARPISPDELKAKGIIMDVVDSAEHLEERSDQLLKQLRDVSPDACRMCKDLAYTSWAHGGQPKQEAVIRDLFEEMMKPDGPGKFGVKEFQAGRKVDWDNYKSGVPTSKL